MKKVVIESPYAGDTVNNIMYAKKCMMDSFNRGEAPYASHLFFIQDGLLDDNNPAQRELGISVGLEWGRSSDLVAVYTDRGISKGMERGIHYAKLKGKRIEYRSIE